MNIKQGESMGKFYKNVIRFFILVGTLCMDGMELNAARSKRACNKCTSVLVRPGRDIWARGCKHWANYSKKMRLKANKKHKRHQGHKLDKKVSAPKPIAAATVAPAATAPVAAPAAPVVPVAATAPAPQTTTVGEVTSANK